MQLTRYMSHPFAWSVIYVTIGVMLAMVGYYVVQRFRGGTDDDDLMQSALSEFREMHHRGTLDDAEYRHVKAVVAAKLQQRRRDEESAGESPNDCDPD